MLRLSFFNSSVNSNVKIYRQIDLMKFAENETKITTML